MIRVLEAFLDQPTGDHWGYELQSATGIKGGSLYPILSRLEAAGWIVGHWEDADGQQGRPPRRLYKLTATGSNEAKDMLINLAPASRAAAFRLS
jgi:PadR family transcriptional regulator PadR